MCCVVPCDADPIMDLSPGGRGPGCCQPFKQTRRGPHWNRRNSNRRPGQHDPGTEGYASNFMAGNRPFAIWLCACFGTSRWVRSLTGALPAFFPEQSPVDSGSGFPKRPRSVGSLNSTRGSQPDDFPPQSAAPAPCWSTNTRPRGDPLLKRRPAHPGARLANRTRSRGSGRL